MENLETRLEAMEKDIIAIKAALGISDNAPSQIDAPVKTLAAFSPISLKQEVAACLRQLGVPTHIKGYRYVREAIILAINDISVVDGITKVLYPQVADTFKTTPSRVERAIRHAIAVAWERGDLDTLHGFFGYTVSSSKGTPTNGEFISTVADYILMKGDTNEVD